ncbi:MAG: YbaK/EbsC family protein [Candidatus Buchananbacteria bacterium]
MVNTNEIYDQIINLLNENQAEFKLFTHSEALTYEALAKVQKEAGFFGSEMKCMVIKTDTKFIVYITLQGNRIDFAKIKEKLGTNKVRLSTAEELNEFFGAQPGCAYPFAFDNQYDIYIDPKIYDQEWLLFSPIFPTKTVQIKGADLKKIFKNLKNNVYEVDDFEL